MSIASLMLLAATASDRAAIQQRLDELLARCEARGVIGLVAESAQAVALRPLVQPGEASVEQQRRVDCVLSGMKAMMDSRFGFVGNEADASGS